ncbi:hypothetical protein B0H17DRAFT_1146251 [Mycena rosella]|uniref:Uncharacterized protein n=1 Tax=Mycena rosella TaxID=1033263 RepID=A0AAD7G0Z4_MYCRO|nr:hypothetical protein B0H17DRAFT_1146251 [Mycena rosella]
MLVPGTGSQIHNIPDWNCWLCVSCRDLPELELAQGKERNLTINFKGPPLLADRSINIAMDDVATDQLLISARLWVIHRAPINICGGKAALHLPAPCSGWEWDANGPVEGGIPLLNHNCLP